MTSLVATDAALNPPLTKNRFLKVNKEGVPINKQVPRTTQNNIAAGPATVTFDGSNDFNVTGALAGVLTVNATVVNNLIGRSIRVFVRGGVGQNVVINFPAAGYLTYVKGAAGEVTSYTLAASANNQSVEIVFGPTIAVVHI